MFYALHANKHLCQISFHFGNFWNYGYFTLRNKYGVNCTCLDILQVRDSIPKSWKNVLGVDKAKHKKYDIHTEIFICNKLYKLDILNTKVVYNHLVRGIRNLLQPV